MLRLLASAAAALLSTAALAAASASESATSWTGLYAGFQGVGAFGDGVVQIPLYPANFGVDTGGLGAGGFAGFNLRINHLIIGIEGDGTLLDVNGSAPTGALGGAERYNVDQRWEASARGRIGVAFDDVGLADTIQVFGTGGAAFTGLQTSYTPASGGSDSATYMGWTAGAGIEAVKGSVFGRVMYRFSDYGSEGFVHIGPSSVSYQTQMISVGLGIRLNSLAGQ